MKHSTKEAILKSKSEIVEVQYLRALAAILVLLAHLFHSLSQEFQFHIAPTFFFGSGVDLFFIISGFIMCISSGRLFAVPGGWKTFVRLRLIRIVPLYWAVTTVFVIYLFIFKDSPPHELHLISSYIFLPYGNYLINDGIVFPVYGLGWTLNYEIFFYVIFALCLFMKIRWAIITIISTLVIFSIVGFFIHIDSAVFVYFTKPIILEFGIGVLIALAFKSGISFPRFVSIPIALLSCLALIYSPLESQMMANADGLPSNNIFRLMGWGLPMSFLLACVVLRDRSQVVWQFSSLKKIGDASYSLYLLHPLVIMALIQVFRFIPLGLTPKAIVFLIVSVASSIGIALLSFRYFEQPVQSFFQNERFAIGLSKTG